MKYLVVFNDETKETIVDAYDIDLEAEGTEHAWFNLTNEDGQTVGAFPFNSVSYICPKG